MLHKLSNMYQGNIQKCLNYVEISLKLTDIKLLQEQFTEKRTLSFEKLFS